MNKTVNKTVKTAESTAKETASKVETAFDEGLATMAGMMDAGGNHVPEFVRTIGETGVNQAKEAYARMKSAAESATDVLEETLDNTRDGVVKTQYLALDAAKENADATFDFAKKLLSAKSVTEAFQLQSGFMRERAEAFVGYSRKMQTATAALMRSASEPVKAAVSEGFDKSKAA